MGRITKVQLPTHHHHDHQTTSTSATSPQFLITSRDGDSITSMGRLFQHLTTFVEKKFFLISNLKIIIIFHFCKGYQQEGALDMKKKKVSYENRSWTDFSATQRLFLQSLKNAWLFPKTSGKDFSRNRASMVSMSDCTGSFGGAGASRRRGRNRL